MIRPGKNEIQRMIEIIEKFPKQGGLVVDNCAGKCSLEMAFMLIPHHKKVVGLDKDDSC